MECQKKDFIAFFYQTLIDFVFKMGENYYPQPFLEEYKFIIKRKI